MSNSFNFFAALNGDECITISFREALFSESYPTIAEASLNAKAKKDGKDESEWTHIKTKKQTDTVSKIAQPIHEDSQLTTDEKELFSRMKEKFIKYAGLMEPKINDAKIQYTSYYTLAIVMMCQIISHLDDIETKNSVFSRTVIRGLMNVGPNNINIIQLIYSYLEFCGEYFTEDFASTTFNGYYGTRKIKKFDINYNLSHSEINLTIGDCVNRFVTLFKIFRTGVAWNIHNSTGSYDIPKEEPENIDDWSYTVKMNGVNYEHSSEQFVNFILDMGVIYEELENLEDKLMCINEIFVEAKKNVASFVEMKHLHDKKNDTVLQKRYREPIDRTKRYNSVQKVVPIKEAKIRAPISTPITWSTSKPATNFFLSEKERKNEPNKYQEKPSVVEKNVSEVKDDGFTLVKKPLTGKAKKNERARIHQQK